MNNTINLKSKAKLIIYFDSADPVGVVHVFTFKNIPNIAGGHTLTLGTQTYTVGSGLLVSGTNLIWTMTSNHLPTGRTIGKIESTSLGAGLYYRIIIEANK